MRVRSTNAVPIIVERAMWWPQPQWYEAHNAPGTTVTGTRWALAGGEVGGATSLQTYVLLANTSTFAGQARVTLYFEDGTTRPDDRQPAGQQPDQRHHRQHLPRGGGPPLRASSSTAWAARRRSWSSSARCTRTPAA